MKSKKNALLESPTGTGKTLALLTSSLAYIERELKEDRHITLAYEEKGVSKITNNSSVNLSSTQLNHSQQLTSTNAQEKILKSATLSSTERKENICEQAVILNPESPQNDDSEDKKNEDKTM